MKGKPMATKKKSTRKVFIRTVTYHYTGEVMSETKDEIVLINAAWIADSGRFAQAMSSGEFSEVEPYPDEFQVAIKQGSITDIVRNWPHDLPRKQK